MMNVFEKIREKLEDAKSWEDIDGKPRFTFQNKHMLEIAIQIVNQVEQENNNGWIPCSERLPEESGEYLTWVSYDNDDFISIDEIDCDGIIKKWNCTYKVIAWQHLPQQYKESDLNGD